MNYADGHYQVDYSAFDQVEKIPTPTISAKKQTKKCSREARDEERGNGSSVRTLSAPNSNSNQNTLRTHPENSVKVRRVDLPLMRPLPKVSTMSVGSASTLPSGGVCRNKNSVITRPKDQVQNNNKDQQRPTSMIVGSNTDQGNKNSVIIRPKDQVQSNNKDQQRLNSMVVSSNPHNRKTP